jgi:transmembrane sensor
MNYSLFSVEDFLHDEAFVAWVKTGADDAFWQAFIRNHPTQAATVAQAKSLIDAVTTLPTAQLNERTQAEMWERIDWRISENFSVTHTSLPPLRARSWRSWYAWAASFALLTVFALWFFTKNASVPPLSILSQNEPLQKVSLAEFTNNHDAPLPIDLPDGSQIILQKNSRLTYDPQTFNTTDRTIHFSGEAFFDIAKNQQKPFLVYANGLITKVLGTSFNIKARPNDRDIVVAVRTGKVSVFKENKPTEATTHTAFQQTDGLVLTPNQQVIFTRETEKLLKTLVEKPLILEQPTPVLFDFNFNQTPISEVFTTLERAYGVSISFDDKILRGCTVTAPLSDESLFEKLDLICKVTRSAYEVLDGQIVVSSRGCQ